VQARVDILQQASSINFLPFEIKCGDNTGEGVLLFAPGSIPAPEPVASGQAAPPDQAAPVRRNGLPVYTRSLLKIRVPLAVSLATTRMPVQRILEIGEGSIIQFSKSCEETLTLRAGSQPIAEGEAVKVGDKFGFRITHMTTPKERFAPVRKLPATP